MYSQLRGKNCLETIREIIYTLEKRTTNSTNLILHIKNYIYSYLQVLQMHLSSA